MKMTGRALSNGPRPLSKLLRSQKIMITNTLRAVALSAGQSAFAYVTMATGVAQPAKDRREFERLLRAAIAVDASKRPSMRLANLIAQKRARFLLSQIDRLFSKQDGRSRASGRWSLRTRAAPPDSRAGR